MAISTSSSNSARINSICLIFLTMFAMTIALNYTKTILIPLVIAFFILTAINPIMNYFQRRFNVPKILAAIFVFIFFTLLTIGITSLIVNSLGDFIRGADAYKVKLFLFLEEVIDLVGLFGYDMDSKSITSEFKKLPVFSYAKMLTGNLLNIISASSLVIIFLLFLLLGSSKKTVTNPFVGEVNKKISQYLFTKFLTSLSTSVLVFLVLYISGVELAFIFGYLTFLLNFIPSIGSLVATFLPLPILFLNFGLGFETWILLGGTGLIQFVIGNIIEPKLMGDGLDLHPITIMVFLLFWGLVWGIPGMFLAAPITAILKIILSKIELTQPFSEVLAGRFDSLFSKSSQN